MNTHLRRISAFFQHPEYVFAVIALVFGVLYGIIVPTGAGFDETTQLARVIEVSTRELIPNRLLTRERVFPFVFIEVNYRRNPFYEPVSADFYDLYKDRAVDWYNGDTSIKTSTRSVYFPLMYIPPAAAVFAARWLNLPVLWVYSLARLAELLGYVLMSFLAIRFIPFGKWTLAFLALSPVAILMASTISTDPYSNGAAFLFMGWVLHLALQETPLQKRQVAFTLLVVALLLSVKVNAVYLVFLLALIPRKKYPSPAYFYLLMSATAALFLIMVIYWNGVVISDFRTDDSHGGALVQLSNIVSNPLYFLSMVAGDLLGNGTLYFRNWIAVFPYSIGVVPSPVYPLYAGLLLLTLLVDPARRPVPGKVRAFLLGSFIAGYAFTVVVVYLGLRGAEGPINIQGRYLTLVAPGLFLACVPARPFAWLRRVSPAGVLWAGGLATLSLFAVGLYLTFYVTCGSSYYTPGLCILPEYRNKDVYSVFTGEVTRGTSVVQQFESECDAIHSVTVWSTAPQAASDQVTNFALRDAVTGEILSQAAIPNRQVPDNDYLEIPIAPIQQASGRLYAIEISSDNPDPTTALNFPMSPSHEYREGDLLIDGEFVKHDLYFHYGCKIDTPLFSR